MKTPIRELPRTEVPPALVYATGVCCGVLAAIAVQIMLSRAGIELIDIWRDILSAQALQMRSAGAWCVRRLFRDQAVAGRVTTPRGPISRAAARSRLCYGQMRTGPTQ